MSLQSRLSNELSVRRAQNLYRQRHVVTSPQGVRLAINGREYLSFCSNDYLGLANDEALRQALRESVDHYGVGSGAAHLISGHSQAHHELEQALAEHTGRSSALLFSTGYMANLGLITSLCRKGDYILQDKLNHASLIDGGLYSAATLKRYRHGDLNQLKNFLQNINEGDTFIATDGVFSMDGDIAPLPELMQLAKQNAATVIVDDAHGLGVLGEHGGGICEHFGIEEDDAPILMGTLGKAFGVFGAFVAGSSTLIEYLIQSARTYIYTTAMPSCLAAAGLASLERIRRESWRREKLTELIEQFRQGCERLELNLMNSVTPIQPLIVGDAEDAVRWSEELAQQGILVKAIRPPTVPQGSARLRITLSSAHTLADVDMLIKALGKLR